MPLLPAPAGAGERPAWPAGTFGTTAPVKGAARAAATGPADGAVLSRVRPELVADRRAGRARYEFVVATGDTPRTGQITSSGWVSSPRWQVPAGVLKDGGRYTWTVRTKDSSGRVGEDAAARGFPVNQRLGAQPEGGPAPTDALGPVTVNLATGNATASVDTAQASTGAGPLGAPFTYNSQALSASSGLTGSYYAGDSAAGIGAEGKPGAVRADARVDFRWGGERVLPDTEPDAAFRVAWTGRLTVPADGTYRLGGAYDGGLRILVDGKPLLDDWKGAEASGDRPAYGRPVRLESGRSYAVEVEHRRPANGRQVGLWASRAGRSAPVGAGATQLHYRKGGLSRFVNPGAETTDFGYTSGDLLAAVRPPLVMDWIAAGAGRDPAPFPGAPRGSRRRVLVWLRTATSRRRLRSSSCP
ncbi:PA14 domain-containing protein [Streptomyces sp. NPDC091287]|uniref:PA14 domain-containing protein n=1 Tax=Streptomyces sp. NPDC091287 TaxID=3365988 RepID=UPI0037FAED6F